MGMIERAKNAWKTLIGEATDWAGVAGRPEDKGFRRLSAASNKELNPADWRRQLEVCHFLWQTNPFAFRVVELTTDFVVGDGFTVEAEDPLVKKCLDDFWKDPDNDFDMTMSDRVAELSMFGAWILRPFVNALNGHVKLAPVDPSFLSKPNQDADRPNKVVSLTLALPGQAEKDYKVIAPVGVPTDPNYNQLAGEIFYFPINKLTFTALGTSDLYRLADWIDALDQFLFHTMERIVFLNAHVYDVELTGANDSVVRAKAGELEKNPPKAGSFRVHNEKEKWNTLTPELGAAEVEQISRVVKLFVLGAAGIPEHWFGDGGNVNRATAGEMGAPILRRYKRRQALIIRFMETMCQFQLDSAVRAGKLSAEKARPGAFKVLAADLSAKDIGQYIDSLAKLTDTLVAAVSAQFTDQVQAAKAWAAQASELGLDIEPMTPDQMAAAAAKLDGWAKEKAGNWVAGPYKDLAAKFRQVEARVRRQREAVTP